MESNLVTVAVWISTARRVPRPQQSVGSHFVLFKTPAASIVVLVADQTDAVTVKFRLNNFRRIPGAVRHTLRKMWFLLLLPIVGTISLT
jgi:hypothetical protein